MEGSTLTISRQATPGGPVIAVAGEIDVASAPALEQELYRTVATGATEVTVDLRQVGFLDSTGIGVLVGAQQRCRQHGGKVRLVIDTDRLRRLFEITGLTGVFQIVDHL